MSRGHQPAEDPDPEAPSPAAPERALDHVAQLVVEGHGASVAATVAAARRRADGTRWERALGAFGPIVPGAVQNVRPKTPFDLASVTKPFVALTLVRLEKRGVLSRSERLGEVVPTLAATPAGQAPLDWLASHRAGLEAHIKLYAPLEAGAASIDAAGAYRSAAMSRRAECATEPGEEGFAPIYSDMGYLLLGLAIETRCGRPLDEVVRDEVLVPLGISGTVGSARQLRALQPTFDADVPPTEIVPFRGGVIRGVVHDENAFAVTGDALSGHAGLFGDAPSVLELGIALVDALGGRSDFLSQADLAPVLRPRPGGTLLAGFDGRATTSPSSGARLGPRTFGHLGFTGTSLWIDPEAEFVGVLLTNRVHPTREHIAIRAARPAAYDAMFDAMDRRR